jgi:L-ribulose-5-phosphate 3-epimerase
MHPSDRSIRPHSPSDAVSKGEPVPPNQPVAQSLQGTPDRERSTCTRRDALATLGALGMGAMGAAGALAFTSGMASPAQAGSPQAGAAPAAKADGNGAAFRISLAQWSFHKALYAGELDHLDFAALARDQYNLDAVEYVTAFFKDKATNQPYLKQMKQRAADAGVSSLLIMVDGEGNLGDPDDAARAQAVDNHRKWLDAAAMLGCHSIRVNAASSGDWDTQRNLAADGLRTLAELGELHNLYVLVENHGGLSSHGEWLEAVMKQVDHPRCGTLPDFGNFCMDWSRRDDPDAWYDRYEGVRRLMPFAKAVSAKSYDFNEAGEDTGTDYARMLKIVTDAGYNGYVGIEYEGSKLSEHEGVAKTLALLERVRDKATG